MATAAFQTVAEAPGQMMVQSRHSLKDHRQGVWQVILFAREEALNLRLVAFPGQYTVRHSDPLMLEAGGVQALAADNFPKGDAVPNVGQFDVQGAIAQLPGDRAWILTIPLTEGEARLTIPREVVLAWQELAQRPALGRRQILPSRNPVNTPEGVVHPSPGQENHP